MADDVPVFALPPSFNARIRQLGERARKAVIGVYVNVNEVDRYLRRLANKYPSVQHISTEPGPTEGVVLLTIGPVVRH